MIITRFASDLSAFLSQLYTWFLDLLGREIQGPPTCLPELHSLLVCEADEKNPGRTTRSTVLGVSVVDSHGRWSQRLGTAVEVL